VISYPTLSHNAKLWPSESGYSDQFWRSLFFFNVYRVVVGIGLITTTWMFDLTNFGVYNYSLFIHAVLAHIVFSSVSILMIKQRKPDFDTQLTLQVIGDIVLICIMIYASGGIQSGLGILLMVSLAGAGLISRWRLALFFAAIAAIAVLLQETYAYLSIPGYSAQYTHAGLLSMGNFAVAWLAHQLATYALANEKLALERGTDLANMAQVNQLVIQDLQEGILVVDKNGDIKQRNAYAEKLIGLQPHLDTTREIKLADYVPVLAARLATWRGNTSTIFDLLRLPNSNIIVRTRFVPIKTNSRAGVVIFLEDMSRIQVQVQQLKLAALGRLSANIAHEIRNPLSSINHAAELLQEEQSNPTNSRLIRIICDNTQRLNKIVQDVLQLNNRRDTTQAETIDTVLFIRTFIDDFCHTEKIDPETFNLEICGSHMINFDSGHLNQVLWNLCRNAWRHSRQQKGSIRILLTEDKRANNICLDILDDGPGVSPQQLKQLFEPFFTTATSGTGLGLYIARELCETNHASLEYIENLTGGHFRIISKKNSSHAIH
jgi:two-component system, NtrC family, sensor histidine kinase PilS